MITNYRGRLHIHHAGNIDGFTSSVDLWPDQNSEIAILTNCSNANNFTDFGKNEWADYMLQLEDTDWNTRFKRARANTVAKFEKKSEPFHYYSRQS